MLVNTPVPIMFAITIAAVIAEPELALRWRHATRADSTACGDRGTRAHRASTGARRDPRPSRETHGCRRGNNALRTGTLSARAPFRAGACRRAADRACRPARRTAAAGARSGSSCGTPAARSMTRSGSASSVCGPGSRGWPCRYDATASRIIPSIQRGSLRRSRESLGMRHLEHRAERQRRPRHDAAVEHRARPRLGARLTSPRASAR